MGEQVSFSSMVILFFKFHLLIILSYISRLANIGEFCSCLVPSSLLYPQQSNDQDSAPLVEKKSTFTGKGYKLTG